MSYNPPDGDGQPTPEESRQPAPAETPGQSTPEQFTPGQPQPHEHGGPAPSSMPPELPGIPTSPGAPPPPPQQYDERGNPVPPGTPTRPPRQAGKIWGGVGIGCGGYVLLFVLMFPLLGVGIINGFGGMSLLFLVPVIVGICLMFGEKPRSWGIGLLIAAAVFWILLFGPCIALMSGL